MGLDGSDPLDNGDEGGKMEAVVATGSSVSASCSICLDAVMKNGDRSWANLQCGHQFHLDCIGSAFNAKGAMQCPNCRKVEKGQWLYANGCRSLPEFPVDDWAPDEDLYDMGYSEMSFGVHWCPFSGLTGLPSSFEEGEFSSGAYHDIGQQANISEHTSISSAGHPCPYMAYVGPIHPSPSNASGSISEGSNFSNNWNGPVTNEMSSSYTFPGMDVHYHSWEHQSSTFPMNSHISGSDQTSIPLVRVARTNYEIPRSGSFMHPFIVAPRAGNSVGSPMFPPHPGSVARARDRVQALQAYFQQPSTSLAVRGLVPAGTRRSSSHRGLSQVGPIGSSFDQNGGFYFFPSRSSGIIPQDIENLMQNPFHAWEHEHASASFSTTQVNRDSGYGPFHQATASSPDTGTRSSSSRLRHGTERIPSQYWS